MALTQSAASDTLWTWGRNYHGELLVVTSDGSLWGCGSDTFGQLGLHEHSTATDGNVVVLTLRKVVGPEFADRHSVLMAACGSMHSEVLAKNNTAWVCGCGRYISGINNPMLYTRALTAINQALFRDHEILVVAGGNSACGAVTEDGAVWVWGGDLGTPSAPTLHARTGRWHNLRPDHTLAFMMMLDQSLGAQASVHGRAVPDSVLEWMFGNMHLEPHTDTLDGLRDRMGCRPPRRVAILDHSAPVLPDDRDEEQ